MFPPDQLQSLLAGYDSSAQRVSAVAELLRVSGPEWREQIGLWVADLLSVEKLVPDTYEGWRPLIHHCMAFFASRISDARLAPKIVEQLELPAGTSVEARLGLVIARMPGLQKLGQVLARTRRLSPSLRRELQKLENEIADMTVSKVRSIVADQLGPAAEAYEVQIADRLLCEGSVSAILEFTWLCPATGRREEGVFKLMKPHVPECYAEDLAILKRLAEDLVSRGASREVAETLEEVRMLLTYEVDFRREQATLAEVGRVYRREGAHAPKPIPELSTRSLTAMSVERGVKVTEAFRRDPLLRRRIASQIVEALIADPIFAQDERAVFHADPHAGNLLYDEKKRQLIVLDWALTGRLTREERRQLAKLIVMMTFRDTKGVRAAIQALSISNDAEIIDRCVDEYFSSLPHACSLGALDAMRLLDQIGVEGVRFPGALVLIRKVMFTLDGVLADVAGETVRMDAIVAREFVWRWIRQWGLLPSPLNLGDYFAVQRSALAYATGLWAWP